jgi:hypothetical protein
MSIDKDVLDTVETRSKLRSVVVGKEIHTDVYERLSEDPDAIKIIVVPGTYCIYLYTNEI